MRVFINFILIAIVFSSCTKEYNCDDLQIPIAFISFPSSDIDTFILKKFKPNANYQNLIDTFKIVYDYTAQYYNSNDTISVFVTDGTKGIRVGFDWQIFIPSKNRTVMVSNIVSEKKTGKCGYGIFSMDKFGCTCTNFIFSAKRDNQIITFSNSDTAKNYIFIKN